MSSRDKQTPEADAATRRPTGAQGHLAAGERRLVMTLWNQRTTTRGAISAIARRIGTSHVAVSNIILIETGKRPSFHDDP